MDFNEWLTDNEPRFGSAYETLFARTVLPLLPELIFDALSAQYPFKDRDGGQRYCDFVIHENDDVRIAIEIDGFDKRGTGSGMSSLEFIDWERRQAGLTSLGWHVLRFANCDVRDEPKRCAEHIRLLLTHSRAKLRPYGLSIEEKARLDFLTKAQNNTIEHLNKETSVMKVTVASFTALILVLVMVIIRQNVSTGPVEPTKGTTENIPPTDPRTPTDKLHISEEKKQKVAVPINGESQLNVVPVEPPTPEQPHEVRLSSSTAKEREYLPEETKLSPTEASLHIGEHATVCGNIASEHTATLGRDTPTLINLDKSYPNHVFTVVVFGSDMATVGNLPHNGRICATGTIALYSGKPQIVIHDAKDWYVPK